VPGVDDYAYLSHVPAELWGLDWLTRGTLSARFLHPVYEGDHVRVRPGEVDKHTDGFHLPLELVDPGGAVCSSGIAVLPHAVGADETDVAPVADAAVAVDPPEASPTSLAPGTVFALDDRTFDADEHVDYLDAVRETLPLYAAERVAHPGWLLRLANRVLASNVRLGPWIHVGSSVRHLDVVRHGDRLATRATVTAEWEKKGHRFVTLDVWVSRLGERAAPVVRIDHTAIYRPRV
jgi:acyl dehydratase